MEIYHNSSTLEETLDVESTWFECWKQECSKEAWIQNAPMDMDVYHSCVERRTETPTTTYTFSPITVLFVQEFCSTLDSTVVPTFLVTSLSTTIIPLPGSNQITSASFTLTAGSVAASNDGTATTTPSTPTVSQKTNKPSSTKTNTTPALPTHTVEVAQ